MGTGGTHRLETPVSHVTAAAKSEHGDKVFSKEPDILRNSFPSKFAYVISALRTSMICGIPKQSATRANTRNRCEGAFTK